MTHGHSACNDAAVWQQELIQRTATNIKAAEEAYLKGDVEGARQRFLQVVREDPENYQANNNLAVIAHSTGDTEEAFNRLARALDLNPGYDDARRNVLEILNEPTADEVARLPGAGWPYLLALSSGGSPGKHDAELMHRLSADLPADQISRLLDILLQVKTAETLVPGLLKVSPNRPPYLTARARQWLVESRPPQPLRDQAAKVLGNHKDVLGGRKVLYGSCEIANQMRTTALALGHLGVTARTLTFYPNYLKFESDYVVDVEAYRDNHQALNETRKLATKLITEYDIFHFHFGTTLTLDHSDLPVLRQFGKKMVAHYWGGEVRVLSRAREINPYVRVKTTNEDVIRRQLQIMANYVPHCVVGDYELREYVKDYFEQVHIIPPMIDLSKYRPVIRVPGNEKLHIVHAPTAPSVKGSQHIVQALDELSHRYDFRFTLVQGMSHEEAKKTYADADIIVDSIHCGTYGLLAIEGMAMGKAVMVGICDLMKNKYPAELPVIPVNPDTIKEQLRFALDNREILPELGIRGRRYVEKHHDMHKVVQQYVDLYQEL